jgi:hypothetical protein
MKKTLRIASVLLAALLFHSYNNSLKAQVKIGGNPAVVDPYSILELESVRKGLLFPRLTATGFMDLVGAGASVKNGLVVYLNEPAGGIYEPGLYIRQAGQWERIGVGGALTKFWSTEGNTLAAGAWFGSINNAALLFKTNNTNRLNITGDGDFDFQGATYKFSSGLGTAGATDNDVLVVGTGGELMKKTFNNINVKSLQALNGDITLGTNAGAHTSANYTVAGQVITLNLPTMANAATQPYGFISAADYLKLQAITDDNAFAMGASSDDAALGADGGKFTKNAGMWELSLNVAGPAQSGMVTSDVQTFGGNKTFNGDVTLSGATTIGSTLSLTTLAAVDAADVSYNMMLRNAAGQVRSVLVPKWKMSTDGISAITVAGGTPADVTGTAADGKLTFEQLSTGTDFTIKAAGTNKIEFEMPSASATARGLVTTGAQTIGGQKTFTAETTVGDGNGAALNVRGGITIKQREFFSGGLVEPADYVLLVKGNGGSTAVPVTLPDPAAPNAGRVYVFNRLPFSETPAPTLIESASVVTITYGGATVAEISEPYTTITIMSTGTKWIVMSRSMGGL